MATKEKTNSLKDNMRWIVIAVAIVCVTLIIIELLSRFAPQSDFAVQQPVQPEQSAIAVTQAELADDPAEQSASVPDGFTTEPDALLSALNDAITLEYPGMTAFTAANDGHETVFEEQYGTRIWYSESEPIQMELMSPAANGEFFAERKVPKQDTLDDSDKKDERSLLKEQAIVATDRIFELAPRALLRALDEEHGMLADMDYHRLSAVLQQSVSSKKEQNALLGNYLIQSIYSTREGFPIVYAEISLVE